MSKRGFYRLVWIVSALAIIGMTVYFPSMPLALPSAGEMVPYSTLDKSISLSYPNNWKPNEASAQGTATGVEFTPNGNTRIVIKTDLEGSLLADISRSGGSPVGGVPGMPSASGASPLEAAHNYQKSIIEKERDSYIDFQDGKTASVQIAGAEGLSTEFTFKRAVGIEIHDMIGKRITALVGDRRLSVVETCPKGAGPEMKPIFDKMLQSLHIAAPGG